MNRIYRPEGAYLHQHSAENILQILPENGILDDTVLVLTSIDHFPFEVDCLEIDILLLCVPTAKIPNNEI